MIELTKKQILYLIGIGAFILASIIGFTGFTRIVFKDLQIWFNVKPNLNFWVTEFMLFIVYFLLAFFFLRTIKSQKYWTEIKLRKVFILWIVLFIITQAFQFFYTLFGTSFVLKYRLEEYSTYSKFIRKEYLLNTYNALFAMLRYLIFGGMVYFVGKTREHTVHN